MRPCRVLLVAVISSAHLGCSFVFVKGPPRPGEKPDVQNETACTERNALPVTDTVVASIFGAEASANFLLMGIGTPPPTQTAAQRHDSETTAYAFIGSALAVAGVTAASAIWGFRTTRRCREYVHDPTVAMARHLPLSDLLCDHDADCEIIDWNYRECCPGSHGEPYAVSRAAVKLHETLDCECQREGNVGGCFTKREDWIAVCADHACKRRSAQSSTWPEVVCQPRSRSK
jgi:hypothetical protein